MPQYVINLTSIYFIHKNDSWASRGAMGNSCKQELAPWLLITVHPPGRVPGASSKLSNVIIFWEPLT